METPSEQDQWSGDEDRDLDGGCRWSRDCPCILCADGPQDDDHLNRNHETVEQAHERSREQRRALGGPRG